MLPFLIILMAIHYRKLWMVNVILEKVLAVTGVVTVLFGPFTAYLACVNQSFMTALGLGRNIEECGLCCHDAGIAVSVLFRVLRGRE